MTCGDADLASRLPETRSPRRQEQRVGSDLTLPSLNTRPVVATNEAGTMDPEQPTAVTSGSEGEVEGAAEPGTTPAKQDEKSSDPNIIEFDGPDDPGNPKNWSTGRKIAITCAFGMLSFVVTFSSSIWSVTVEPVSREFGVSTLVVTLGVTLFLLVSRTQSGLTDVC